METVLLRAHESSDFRLKSIENHSKTLILQGFYGSGPRGRGFKSRHLDQKGKHAILRVFLFVDDELVRPLALAKWVH